MCIAVGNVSFDDCDMFTSSFGWIGFFEPRSPPASSIARFEITSLTFMFVCVPLPVCQTESGNSSSSLPAMTSSAARTMSVGLLVGQLAEVPVHERGGLLEDRHAADHGLGHAVVADREVVQATAGSARPSTGRPGTSIGPMLSVSVRVRPLSS